MKARPEKEDTRQRHRDKRRENETNRRLLRTFMGMLSPTFPSSCCAQGPGHSTRNLHRKSLPPRVRTTVTGFGKTLSTHVFSRIVAPWIRLRFCAHVWKKREI